MHIPHNRFTKWDTKPFWDKDRRYHKNCGVVQQHTGERYPGKWVKIGQRTPGVSSFKAVSAIKRRLATILNRQPTRTVTDVAVKEVPIESGERAELLPESWSGRLVIRSGKLGDADRVYEQKRFDLPATPPATIFMYEQIRYHRSR